MGSVSVTPCAGPRSISNLFDIFSSQRENCKALLNICMSLGCLRDEMGYKQAIDDS